MYLKLKTNFIVLVLAVVLTGCGSIAFKKPDKPNQSMIIGFIDMADAPGDFNGVVMKQIKPATKKPYHYFWIKEGMFFSDDISQGVYKMDNFKSYSGWRSTQYSYNFPKTGGKGEMDLKIKRPGIYYAGSWKYKEIKTGFFEKGKFELVRIKSPSEMEILTKIKKYSKDSYWTNMINKRISQLKRTARKK